MKYTKKMRLVECSENNNSYSIEPTSTTFIKNEDYSTPRTLQSLDKEMESILNDDTIDIDQKWVLYHRVLQRYLTFIKRIRQGDLDSSANPRTESVIEPLLSEDFKPDLNGQENRFSSTKGVTRMTSTPKNDSKHTFVPELPIRIQKRLIRQQKQIRHQKKVMRLRNENIPNVSSALEQGIELDNEAGENDEDDEYYYDYDDDSTTKTFTTPTGTVVNGWTKSNIIL